jgi:GNAT superfamily N-acetyltransferase
MNDLASLRFATPLLQAQASYLRFLDSAAPSESMVEDGVFAVRTGVCSNTQNGVISGSRVTTELIEKMIAWFAAEQLPASWLLAEDGLRLGAALLAAGCDPEEGSVEMRALLDDLDLSKLSIGAAENLSITVVASQDDLEAWLSIATRCGWFDDDADKNAARRLYSDLVLKLGSPLRFYLARAANEFVGMASAFYSDETVLLDSVAVLTNARRRGIGRALALARLHEARERGCTEAVLAPSPHGGLLYDRLGFERHRQPAGRWFYLPTSGAGAD